SSHSSFRRACGLLVYVSYMISPFSKFVKHSNIKDVNNMNWLKRRALSTAVVLLLFVGFVGLNTPALRAQTVDPAPSPEVTPEVTQVRAPDVDGDAPIQTGEQYENIINRLAGIAEIALGVLTALAGAGVIGAITLALWSVRFLAALVGLTSTKTDDERLFE